MSVTHSTMLDRAARSTNCLAPRRGAVSIGVAIAEARRDSENDGEITVRGRIGGEEKPFVDGLAAFTIVDTKLKPCEEGCETPWDYCCSLDELPTHKALVKLVDSQGQIVEGDARKLLGIKELSIVTIRGRAKRDDVGNLTVLAAKVFVEK